MKYPELETGTDNNTVVFDFDGVLAVPVWPDPGIGEPIYSGLEMLKHYHRRGFRILIHTARHWADMEMIRAWLVRQLAELSAGVVVICGKPLAQLYVDDRAFRFEAPEGIVTTAYEAYDPKGSPFA